MTKDQLESYAKARTAPVKFDAGQIVATPGASEAIEEAESLPFFFAHKMFLLPHTTGDYGDIGDFDAKQNDAACKFGISYDDQQRIMSAYTLSTGVKIWLITEWDRSLTTFLLPSEY